MINKEPIPACRLVRCPLREYHIVHSLPAVSPRSIRSTTARPSDLFIGCHILRKPREGVCSGYLTVFVTRLQLVYFGRLNQSCTG
jgi:hypothetical protein